MKKILETTNICMFCGQEEKEHFEEYTRYFECDCSDAVEYRRIEREIEKLKQKLPQPKFEVIMKPVLYSKSE